MYHIFFKEEGGRERLADELGHRFKMGTLLCLLCTQVSVGLLQFSSGQLLSRVWLLATPWIAARQASLSITNSQHLLKLMVMPSSHLILCRPLLLLPPTPPSIRVFSSESALRMRWPKYWSFSFSISPSNEDPGSPLGWTGWISLLRCEENQLTMHIERLKELRVRWQLRTIHFLWPDHWQPFLGYFLLKPENWRDRIFSGFFFFFFLHF